MTEQQSTRN